MATCICNLRRYRRAAGHSREQLSALSGVSEATIRRIEHAEARGRSSVRPGTRVALAGALGVSEESLSEEAPEARAAEAHPLLAPGDTYSGLDLDLAGTSEAASILGVSRQRVNALHGNHRDFPPVVDVLAQGPVWAAEDIRKFAAMERRAGKPGA